MGMEAEADFDQNCGFSAASARRRLQQAADTALLTRRDVRRAGEVLKQAFVRDPIHRWLLPEMRDWRRGSAVFWRQLLQKYLVEGVVVDDGAGVAAWVPPRFTHVGPWQELRSQLAMLYALGRHAGRGLQVARVLRHARVEEPHWYLAIIGVHPSVRGRGRSRPLIDPVLRLADEAGVCCYLESSNRQNIPVYSRYGFYVHQELQPAGGPPLWAMVRPPVTGMPR